MLSAQCTVRSSALPIMQLWTKFRSHEFRQTGAAQNTICRVTFSPMHTFHVKNAFSTKRLWLYHVHSMGPDWNVTTSISLPCTIRHLISYIKFYIRLRIKIDLFVSSSLCLRYLCCVQFLSLYIDINLSAFLTVLPKNHP